MALQLTNSERFIIGKRSSTWPSSPTSAFGLSLQSTFCWVRGLLTDLDEMVISWGGH